MMDQLALLPSYLTAHLQLTLIALFFSVAISLPLGILSTRVTWLEAPVLSVAGVIQTIPSLALLAVMVPLLATLHLQSIGFLPAIIGLTLYGVLPILRNTVTGISGVAPELVEAARGVGMTPNQRLINVELPLSMPVIVAGIRTATVWIVGIATLSTPIGATSLGNYIFSGLQTRNFKAVLVGSLAAAGLALLLDSLVRMLEIAIRERRRVLGRIVSGVFFVLYVYTGISLAQSSFLLGKTGVITIGSKTFTEQYILSSIISRCIESETEHETRLLQSLGSTVAFDALRSGDIDMYVDYSGTVWATIMERGSVPEDRNEVLREVTSFLRNEHKITVIGALGFENTYALAVSESDGKRLQLREISDLVPYAQRMLIGGDYEFFARPEWQAIQKNYGIGFKESLMMDSSLMYQAVDQGDVDIISAFSTDGRITSFDLRMLKDDRLAIPPYDAILLVGEKAMRDYPAAVASINALVNAIDVDQMRRMNFSVDEGGKTPEQVADQFIKTLSQPEALN